MARPVDELRVMGIHVVDHLAREDARLPAILLPQAQRLEDGAPGRQHAHADDEVAVSMSAEFLTPIFEGDMEE